MSKSAEAFRTISEVAEVLDTPAHVLRFWESRFTQIKPLKRAGGRRYYRPGDVALLAGIRRLLHEDGLTIRGVQKILKERGVKHVAGLSRDSYEEMPPSSVVAEARPGAQPGAQVDARPEIVADALWSGTDAEDERAFAADLFAASADDEAPMVVDAPALPEDHATEATPFPSHGATQRAPAETGHFPAASLLRAMDALRAESKRGELKRVHDRLEALRERLASRG